MKKEKLENVSWVCAAWPRYWITRVISRATFKSDESCKSPKVDAPMQT